MADYYMIGQKPPKPRHPIMAFCLCALLLLGAGTFGAWKVTRSSPTTIVNAPAATHMVADPNAANKMFDEGDFSFRMASYWVQDPIKHDNGTAYSFHSSKAGESARSLTVYEDASLQTVAVNRLLPVQAASDHLVPGQVSPNCTTLAGPNKAPAASSVQAVWQNVTFLCDTANVERDVVGAAAAGAANAAMLTGARSGTHKFFFEYVDHAGEPSYDPFTQALQTFKVK